MACTIVNTKNEKTQLADLLNKGIADYAQEKKGLPPIEIFSFSLKDEKQNLVGGCSGVTYYGCLYVDMLWVDEKQRYLGYGTQLMDASEKLGKEKKCLFATVNTMDWEALDFYKKLGYQIEFERHGYLKNSVFYFLRKAL